jgi:hypothetical protein
MGRGVKVTSELTVEDVDDMRRSGQYVNLPPDDAEARRFVVRARLAYLTDMSDGHLVLADPAGWALVPPATGMWTSRGPAFPSGHAGRSDNRRGG